MKYKEHEIDISITSFSEGVAIIPLEDGTIVCISEQDATEEELVIIAEIKADVKARPVIEVPEVIPQPTSEERISSLELLVLQLSGVI